jgi:hypothetical protein
MPALAPILLSGSTSGKQIKITPVVTPGTTLHTAVSGTTSFDEIWLYAVNTSASTVTLTLEVGGTTAPDDNVIVQIPPNIGPVNVLAGLRMNGGVVVKAFASVANVIDIHGNVNRYTP